MSGGSSSGGGEGGWGSKFFKVAGAAAATAAAAGGLYALLTSSAPANSEPEVPFQASRRVSKEPEDPWSTQHEEIPSYSRSHSQSQIRWTKPEFGWVKLNVDGSRVHETPSAACGGVLRDSSGRWLLGFSRKLNPSFQVHETELWAIFTGLQLAWDSGVKKLVVESDRKSAVDLVNNGFKSTHPQSNIIASIKELLDDDEWQVKLTLISNEANRLADKLAWNAHELPDGLHQFPSPPCNCSKLLLEDTQ